MHIPYRSRLNLLFYLPLALLLACSDSSDTRPSKPPVEPPIEPSPIASAREAVSESDLLQGPLARSRPGDFVLENELFG